MQLLAQFVEPLYTAYLFGTLLPISCAIATIYHHASLGKTCDTIPINCIMGVHILLQVQYNYI
jgi:hypothetical protein